MPTVILSKGEVSKLLDMAEVIPAVEEALRLTSLGLARMPSKSYLSLEKGDFRAMPAFLPGSAGIKWVNVHPGNPARGLPTVMAAIIYNNPDTGYPLAIMDATDITAYRTGAAAAVASKYLARRDAATLGIVGTGRQAQAQLLAHASMFTFKLIRVYDVERATAEKFARLFPDYPIEVTALAQAAGCDIVCTVTPARQPVVKREWIQPGAHINAIGADAPGKEELDPDILNIASIFVDDMKQATTSGEINVPLSKGYLNPSRILGTLGEVITGSKTGRRRQDEITVFDSTGIAVEDIACARLIYDKISGNKDYLWLNFVEE